MTGSRLLADELSRVWWSDAERKDSPCPMCGKLVLEVLSHDGGLMLYIHKMGEVPGGVVKEGCAHLVVPGKTTADKETAGGGQ